jgi:hypothetical protein
VGPLAGSLTTDPTAEDTPKVAVLDSGADCGALELPGQVSRADQPRRVESRQSSSSIRALRRSCLRQLRARHLRRLAGRSQHQQW